MKVPTASAISGNATSRIMRRRLRGNFFASDLAPSDIDGESDTTFNEGSAITLHVLQCLIGNSLPEVFPREPELRKQHVNGGRIDAGQHLFRQLLDLARDAVEQRACGRGEVKPFGAAIIRVGPALDQAVVAKPVDEPGQRDRLNVEVL